MITIQNLIIQLNEKIISGKTSSSNESHNFVVRGRKLAS